MAKQNSYIRYTLVLGTISLVCSLGVALVYSLTRDAIASNKAQVEKEAMAFCLSALHGDPEPIKSPDTGTDTGVFRARNEAGELIGYLAVGKATGYGGEIAVMVGLKPDLETISGIRVVSHSETPGLGARVDEVKTDETIWSKLFGKPRKTDRVGKKLPEFQKQFLNRPVGALEVVKVRDGKNVVAITAATITSRAVVNAVLDAVEKIKKTVTSQNDKR